MASSSIQSSSSALMTMTGKYDVFVSFRGQDTRHSFTSHLFDALQRNGIVAFRDDIKLKKGKSIAPELLRAIEGSKVFILVLSKNYASSTWCLRELEKILECVHVSARPVLPIFYHVDPSDVRHQKGSYAEAFAKHEERFIQDSEMVQRWRDALTQVANLSGWDLHNKSESEEIKNIVKEITNILGHEVSCPPNDLVGIHSPMEELEKLLELGLVNEVRVLGISGMGGIGKTTLAATLYRKISRQFDAHCFIDDVSKIYVHDGPIGAQKQILYQTLGEEGLQIRNPHDGANLIQSRLHHLRSLIILDNVDKVEQLEKLALNREWLGVGSRIIVISRDEHILNVYGVNKDKVYKVPLLNETHTLQLFCQKAFKQVNIMSDDEQLAHDILYYCNGLPLAIKVLGSFLCDLDMPEWSSALVTLRECPNEDIMNVLRLSFDGLQEMEKEIFLDIACFFNGGEEKYVKNILNCCGFHPNSGLRVLVRKSLISILQYDSSTLRNIEMHGLLQELGRKIVQEKWSRLWLCEHVYNVMSRNMENNVEAVVYYQHRFEQEEVMAEAMSKMTHLRLLITRENAYFSGSLTCLSNNLRYVEWPNYPFKYLPSSFHPMLLVELYLQHSNIKQLWEGKKYLPKLRTMDLRHSKYLIKTPHFGEVPNLEQLNLKGCEKLVEIDPSIGDLGKLVYLNLKDCKDLLSIPNNIFGLSSLKYVSLSGCSKVSNNPRYLKKHGTSKSELHSQPSSSFFKWITLPFRSLYPTRRAQNDLAISCCVLPSICSLSCLCELDISFCSLSQIPDAIGRLCWLEKLNLGGNNFVTLPSLKELSKLVCLNLQHCKQLKSLPELPFPVSIKWDPHPMFSLSESWTWRPGLYIFNCLEFGERDLCRSKTLSWFMQLIQANQESPAPFGEIELVIPGSEIPMWSNNQSVSGSSGSIRMDPSPIMHDDDFIGIAYYAVFSVAPGDSIASGNESWLDVPGIWLGFDFECSGFRFNFPMDLDRDLTTGKLDHTWLIYLTRDSFFDHLGSRRESDIRMEVNIVPVQGLHMEFKNIGYCWVFKQDLQLMHCGNLSSRKRKFLAIEDEAQPQHNHSSD